ncbi:MAG TPA: alternative ribosome rescue aminoacyl-tRNA hydrolase ArfB [Rhizomicrobium sp.]
MAKILVTGSIEIDDSLLSESFIRASGPGGQNVNKVASAVQLRFDARRAALPFDMHARLEVLAGSRLTKDGEVIITAQQYRDQQRNREDARERLLDLLRRAAFVPKKRRPSKPSKASKLRGIQKKKTHSELKKTRSKKIYD